MLRSTVPILPPVRSLGLMPTRPWHGWNWRNPAILRDVPTRLARCGNSPSLCAPSAAHRARLILASTLGGLDRAARPSQATVANSCKPDRDRAAPTAVGLASAPRIADMQPTFERHVNFQNLNSSTFAGVTIWAGPRITSPLAPTVYSPRRPAVNFSPCLPVILPSASASEP